MMITNLKFLNRILMAFHIKSTNQRLCNGLRFGKNISLFSQRINRYKHTQFVSFYINLSTLCATDQRLIESRYAFTGGSRSI